LNADRAPQLKAVVICRPNVKDMKSILTVAALNLLVVLVCVAQESAKPLTPSQTEGEIRKLTRSWDKAMVKRDVPFLDKTLSDDYVISGMAKPQYLELIKSSEIKYTSFDREIRSVRVYGDTALVLGQTNVNGQSSPQGWFSSTFSFMDVWVKQQGRWRCVATKAEEIVQTYQKQKIVKFGPDAVANLVIVFKPEVPDDQVEEFRRNVLQIVASAEGERSYSPGIRQYLRTLPIQDHEAIALTFHTDITPAQRAEIMSRIKASPLVYKLFEDIAPSSLKLGQ
jgi:ketosteroid isomerase-like protein